MSTAEITITESVLNDASRGLALAQDVLVNLEHATRVVIDYALVERMTPSFSNAFVMTLLERHAIDALRERVVSKARNEQVAAAMSRSARRYLEGVRLAHQRFVA